MTEQRLKDETKILKRIDEIRPSNPKKSDYTHGIDVGLAMAKVAIKDAPTIEERKTGKWICSDDLYETAICSCCGWDTTDPWDHIRNWFMYCPNCGADMRGESDD